MLTSRLIDHRILIVLDPDTGALRGAHEDRLTAVMDGETQVATRPEGGIPLSPETLAAVLPDQAALMSQVQALTAERDAAVTARTTAETEADGLRQQLATAQARIAQLEALQAQIDQIQAAATGDCSTVAGRLVTADMVCNRHLDAGILVTLPSGPSVSVDTTARGQANVLGLMMMAQQAGPGWSTTWYQSTGDVTIGPADLQAIGAALAAHTAGCYATWGDVVAAIKAQPAVISTAAQIEAPETVGVVAWP